MKSTRTLPRAAYFSTPMCAAKWVPAAGGQPGDKEMQVLAAGVVKAVVCRGLEGLEGMRGAPAASPPQASWG